jgi:PhzF family phenazine biosynthesis protein
LYQVDAFTDQRFRGNPAAVVLVDAWPADAVMQAIAAENNLAETAFIVPAARGSTHHYDLRWFTPTVEVDLCGHATLASAHVLSALRDETANPIVFRTRSGDLPVSREAAGDGAAGPTHTLDFPANPPTAEGDPAAVAAALGAEPVTVLTAGGFGLAVFENEDNVAALSPNMDRIAALPLAMGVIATAPGRAVDVVSRFFAPRAGIPEDPVTGAAHTVLIPYWAERLGRRSLSARQVSWRGGDLACRLAGARVLIGGRCALYLEGRIHL